MKNVPYVKQLDKNGNIKNPIKGGYFHNFETRQKRRSILSKDRFFGNGKNFHLTVTKVSKHLRLVQREFDKDGNSKIIYHYLPR